MTVARRLKAAVLIGLIWAVAWGLIVSVAGTLIEVATASRPQIGGWTLSGILHGLEVPFVMGAVVGFLAGTAFAALVGTVGRRSSIETLTNRRVALWGGLGSALLIVVARLSLNGLGGGATALLAIAGFFGMSGAVSAVLMLRAAKGGRVIGSGDLHGIGGGGSHELPILDNET
jgi:hypothetical protein